MVERLFGLTWEEPWECLDFMFHATKFNTNVARIAFMHFVACEETHVNEVRGEIR